MEERMLTLRIPYVRFAVMVAIVAALVTGAGWLPSWGKNTVASQAWAGGRSGGHGHGEGDNDDDHDKNHKKHFDHFACYEAGDQTVDKDVKIVNQFTVDDNGNLTPLQITVGKLVLLCVPTKKILLDDPHR